MVRSGRLQEMLAGGNQVEDAYRVPEELARAAPLQGAVVEPVAGLRKRGSGNRSASSHAGVLRIHRS